MSVELIEKRLRARSSALLMKIEGGLDRILIGWLLIAGLAATLRGVTSPINGSVTAVDVLPLLLVVLAPVASVVLALRWFSNGAQMAQPEFRLARIGRWRDVSPSEAARHPLFGPSGIMVSLLVGTMLNVPVRVAEYLAAMPMLTGPVPEWLSVLHAMMTIDVVVLTSLYCIAFVAALRCVPLFPRLLFAIWLVDLAMQLLIARAAAGTGLPPDVAASLSGLLEGNVKKVLISAALWLPYLILSKRVNVTYRKRLPAEG